MTITIITTDITVCGVRVRMSVDRRRCALSGVCFEITV